MIQQIFSRSLLSFALAVSLSLPSMSMALGHRCSDIFYSSSSKFKIQASEWLRQNLESLISDYRTEADDGLKRNLAIFQVEVDRRDAVDDLAIQDAISKSEVLSAIDFYELEVTKMVPGGSVRPPTLGSEIDSKDPYFVWLKHNSLDFRVKNHNADTYDRRNFNMGLRQIEPLELLARFEAEGLTREQAAILVQAKLDPTLSARARLAAEKIRKYAQFQNVIDRHVMPLVRFDAKSEVSRAAWLLIPSLEDGRMNLRLELDRQVEQYGSVFSRQDYERIRLKNKETPKYFRTLRDYEDRLQKHETTLSRDVMSYLKKVRTDLKLNPALKDKDLANIIFEVLRTSDEESYESTIVHAFRDGGLRPHTIDRLRSLIELTEAFENRRTAILYLTAKIPPPKAL